MLASPEISVDGSYTITSHHDGNSNLEPFVYEPFYYSGDVLFDGNPLSATDIKEGSVIDIAFDEPFLSEKLVIHFRRRFQRRPYSEVHFNVILTASSDGKDYREVYRIVDPVLNQTLVFEIPAVKAKYYRLEIRDQVDSEKDRGFALGELELLKKDESPRYNTYISHHLEKTVTTKAIRVEDFFSENQVPEEIVNASEMLDISSKMNNEGVLIWDAPEGNWTILRVGYTTTGHANHPASRAGRGLEVDKMDTAALNLHFQSFTSKLLEQAGPLAGSTFQFLLIDSWECKYLNWTDRFPEEFEKRRGYSISPWLAVICGVMIQSPESTERFLHDFRTTIAELIEENYYRHFSVLCKKNGLEAHTEVIYGGQKGDGATIYPPLDNLRANSYMDMPMYEFWAPSLTYTPVHQATVTMVAEAAALYGKNIVGSEAYTGYANYEESPWDLKLYGDNAFCSGINQMILASYVHQPDERKPGMTLGRFGQSFHRHIPWWEFSSQWFEYQARIQYVLQKGVRSADLLYFIGDKLYEPDIEEKGIYQIPYGYSIQRCNLDILLNHSQVKNGKIILSNGMSYEILLMPGDEGMELASLKRIAELVHQGAKIAGPKPTRTLSYHNHEMNDREFQTLCGQIWQKDAEAFPEGHGYGKGWVFPSTDIQAVVDILGLKPEFSSPADTSPNLMYFYKKSGNDEIYFVVNQESKPVHRDCHFRVEGKHPEIWDPVYGSVSVPYEYSKTDGVVKMPVNFQSRESLFFIFRDQKTRGLVPRPVPEEIFQLKNFTGTIGFEGSAPADPLEITKLQCLTEFEDSRIKYFAGIAEYNIIFDVPENILDLNPLFISPGQFSGSCEVTLNGVLLGSTTFPEYRFDVSDQVKATGNVLKVRVGNNFKNRIIGDYIEYGELRNLWTTNSYIGSDDPRFPGKNSDLQKSGLIGPVKFLTFK